MKNLLTVLLISGFIVACGGEGGSGSSVAVTLPTETPGDVKPVEPVDPATPIIPNIKNPNGYTEAQIRADWTDIPPMPLDSHPEYYSIKGVDDYGEEGIRDDWEVLNAIASYPDLKERALLNN